MDLSRESTPNQAVKTAVLNPGPQAESITAPAPVTVGADPGLTALGLDLSSLPPVEEGPQVEQGDPFALTHDMKILCRDLFSVYRTNDVTWKAGAQAWVPTASFTGATNAPSDQFYGRDAIAKIVAKANQEDLSPTKLAASLSEALGGWLDGYSVRHWAGVLERA